MATIILWPAGMAAMTGSVPGLPEVLWHIHQLLILRYQDVDALELALSSPAP
jgi:hypothetical protein